MYIINYPTDLSPNILRTLLDTRVVLKMGQDLAGHWAQILSIQDIFKFNLQFEGQISKNIHPL